VHHEQGQAIDSQNFKVLRFLRNFLKNLKNPYRPFTVSNLDFKVRCIMAIILWKRGG